MTLGLTDIEQKAKAATPGPWRWNNSGEMVGPQRADLIDSEYDYDNPPPWMDGDHCPILIQTDSGQYPPRGADAAFIAAANPSAVLAMVARIRELETRADATTDIVGKYIDEGARRIATIARQSDRIRQLESLAAERYEDAEAAHARLGEPYQPGATTNALRDRIRQLEAALVEACDHMHHARWCHWHEWEAARSECTCGNEARLASLRAIAGAGK